MHKILEKPIIMMAASVMPKSIRAKTGPPVQLWQANFDPMGPILVAKTGPPAPKMDPVRYWLARNGPSPILACQKRTQSNIGLPKTDPVQYWLSKMDPVQYWLILIGLPKMDPSSPILAHASYINWLAKLCSVIMKLHSHQQFWLNSNHNTTK